MAARFDLKRFLADERGATAIEYGLLIAIISVVVVAAYGNLQSVLISIITNAVAKVDTATN